MKKHIILILFLASCFTSCEKDESLGNTKLYPFFNEAGKWGYIDINGDVKIEPQWNGANRFVMDRAIVFLNYKPGLIDESGNLLIQFNVYESIGIADIDLSLLFNPKLLLGAKKNGLCGYLDKDGTVVIPFIYEGVNGFSDGMAAVKISGKFGYINEAGNLLIPAIYDGFGFFREGLCWVGKLTDGVIKWGVINKSGETVIPFDYNNRSGSLANSNWYVFINGISPWYINGVGFGFLNTDGEPLFGLTGNEYDFTGNFSDGLAVVGKNSLIGFLDENGNVAISLAYRNVFDFTNGTAPFRYPSDEFWGYLKKNGEVFMDPQFLNAWSIFDGLGWVMFQDSTAGYINEKGNTVWRSTVILGSWNK